MHYVHYSARENPLMLAAATRHASLRGYAAKGPPLRLCHPVPLRLCHPVRRVAAPSLSQLMHNRETSTGPVAVPSFDEEKEVEFDWDRELQVS